MEQTSWFDWGREKDPIFIELQKLSHQSTVYISPFTITKNPYGLYEMESPDTHDCKIVR